MTTSEKRVFQSTAKSITGKTAYDGSDDDEDEREEDEEEATGTGGKSAMFSDDDERYLALNRRIEKMSHRGGRVRG